MEFAKNVKNNCHDCGKKIRIKGGEIENGVLLEYDNGSEKLKVFKCNDCYEKNPALTNFNECEVYSRVVGYLRPVQQWNQGKNQEYSDRQEYKI